jgi:uncharacterized protein YutD
MSNLADKYRDRMNEAKLAKAKKGLVEAVDYEDYEDDIGEMVGEYILEGTANLRAFCQDEEDSKGDKELSKLEDHIIKVCEKVFGMKF